MPQDEEWLPPCPDISQIKPFTDPLRVLLDDVDKELLVLISQQPEDERRMAKPYSIPSLAMHDVERILGCQGCRRAPWSTWSLRANIR